MQADPLTRVFVARDAFHAQHAAGLLASEGLHPRVPGSELLDELATAQRTAGILGQEVYVPESERALALEILEAWVAGSGADRRGTDPGAAD